MTAVALRVCATTPLETAIAPGPALMGTEHRWDRLNTALMKGYGRALPRRSAARIGPTPSVWTSTAMS